VRRLFCFLLLTAAALSAGPKSLFYLTSDPAGIASFLQHASKIDILVPTWYNVDPAGAVSGGPNAQVMDAAKRFHVPVMPIIVNPGFNQDNFHKLVTDSAARRKMIAAIAAESRKQGYIGFQFDFENIIETDRDALTVFVTEGAQAMHQAGLQLSIATVPNAPGYAGEGGFSKWIFTNWRAAYDLKGIGAAVDLLCLMTYDEHTRYTPPGPVAGHQWTVANLDYALKSVPKLRDLQWALDGRGCSRIRESNEQTGANVKELLEYLRLLLTDGTLSRQNLGDAAFGADDRPEIRGPQVALFQQKLHHLVRPGLCPRRVRCRLVIPDQFCEEIKERLLRASYFARPSPSEIPQWQALDHSRLPW
jgi:spore germination protein YaaH